MKNPLTNYEAVCEYLFYRPNYERTGRGVWKLDKMQRLLAALDHPQLQYRTIHIGGTNGKGSTSAMMAAILQASGANVGLHTSPHLLDFAERFRYNGSPAEHDWIVTKVQEIEPIIERIKPSFFEISTALAFCYFADKQVDWGVIEVGLGGRWDATNVLHPEAIAITNIGFDHTDKLGNTRREIATEKAGIFRRGVPVFTTETHPEALDALETEAMGQDAPLFRVNHFPFQPSLLGQHQRLNAGLATAVSRHLGISDNAIQTGLSHVETLSGLRGRLEVIHKNPTIIMDVGHNAEGIQTAFDFLGAEFPNQNISVLIGLMKDKDAEKVAQLLKNEQVREVFAVQSDSPRALSATKLGEIMESVGLNVKVSRVEDGIKTFENHAQSTDILLICGSHYVVEQGFKHFFPKNEA